MCISILLKSSSSFSSEELFTELSNLFCSRVKNLLHIIIYLTRLIISICSFHIGWFTHWSIQSIWEVTNTYTTSLSTHVMHSSTVMNFQMLKRLVKWHQTIQVIVLSGLFLLTPLLKSPMLFTEDLIWKACQTTELLFRKVFILNLLTILLQNSTLQMTFSDILPTRSEVYEWELST